MKRFDSHQEADSDGLLRAPRAVIASRGPGRAAAAIMMAVMVTILCWSITPAAFAQSDKGMDQVHRATVREIENQYLKVIESVPLNSPVDLKTCSDKEFEAFVAGYEKFLKGAEQVISTIDQLLERWAKEGVKPSKDYMKDLKSLRSSSADSSDKIGKALRKAKAARSASCPDKTGTAKAGGDKAKDVGKKGTITDGVTGEAIAGAEIVLVDPGSKDPPKKIAKADKTGGFKLDETVTKGAGKDTVIVIRGGKCHKDYVCKLSEVMGQAQRFRTKVAKPCGEVTEADVAILAEKAGVKGPYTYTTVVRPASFKLVGGNPKIKLEKCFVTIYPLKPQELKPTDAVARCLEQAGGRSAAGGKTVEVERKPDVKGVVPGTTDDPKTEEKIKKAGEKSGGKKDQFGMRSADMPGGQYSEFELFEQVGFGGNGQNKEDCPPPTLQPPKDAELDQPRRIADARPVSDPLALSRGSWGQNYEDQWALRRIGWLDTRGLAPLPETGEPVVVAVIDSGLDRGHPDIVGSTWLNEDEIPFNGLDDDNNGYVDDLYGWNFYDDNEDVTDLNGHGTVVAGIIAARANNGFGIAGLNPWAKIMPIRVTDVTGEGGSVDLSKAIFYAADNGARVINISMSGLKLTRHEQRAVDHAHGKGVVIVVASGNDGENTANYAPAGLANVITVAASGLEDNRVNYSNWGQAVDIAAPGDDILSLRAAGTDLLIFERDDYRPGTAIVDDDYYRVTGTSFAAPMVAGAASLIFSTKPKTTAQQVRRMLLNSARDIDVPGRDQYSGAGLLDVRAALATGAGFFLEASISGVEVVKVGGALQVRVSGTARADRFAEAWLEIGAGEAPEDWKRVGQGIGQPVAGGALDDIAASSFAGAKVWIIRLITRHAGGKTQEARFRLKTG